MLDAVVRKCPPNMPIENRRSNVIEFAIYETDMGDIFGRLV
jgi:hypothetical protein